MELKKTAMAGTVESNDILITVEPGKEGIKIDLDSPIKKQFGSQMIHVIEETLKQLQVDNANVKAVDKGALDFVIESRVKAAVFRASEVEDYDWGELI
ncbi:MAG: citrate lyase acyl carrier protein [Tissierellia bacterium]|nr:citrate lyase acyl carrier protein [Tissierellia bacterium]